MSSSKKELVQVSSYSRKLKDNVKSIVDNYGEILKAAKVSENETERVTESHIAHVQNEIEVRAANIVRAAEALSKLVSDLKENLILNDFSTINDATSKRIKELEDQRKVKQQELEALFASTKSNSANPPISVDHSISRTTY